eukprot:4823119-Amphidinium_carterae.1
MKLTAKVPKKPLTKGKGQLETSQEKGNVNGRTLSLGCGCEPSGLEICGFRSAVTDSLLSTAIRSTTYVFAAFVLRVKLQEGFNVLGSVRMAVAVVVA